MLGTSVTVYPSHHNLWLLDESIHLCVRKRKYHKQVNEEFTMKDFMYGESPSPGIPPTPPKKYMSQFNYSFCKHYKIVGNCKQENNNIYCTFIKLQKILSLKF